jgi:arabinofuranosyltransferase
MRRVMAGIAILLCATSGALHQHYYDFLHDDAFIAFRYAANWAAGIGPVYNPGERVEGYSDFLWVAMLRAAAGAGRDVLHTARGLGSAAGIALALAAAVAVGACLRRSWRLAAFAAASVALHACPAVWALSGLETVPFAFLVLAASIVFLHERRRGRAHWGSGLLFAAVALLRADGFLFLFPAVVLAALQPGRRTRALVSLGAAFAVVAVPYAIWRWSFYGSLLPNTYYAKTGGGLLQQVRGLFYVYNVIEPFGGVLLWCLPLVLLALRDRDRDSERLYFGLLVAGVGAAVVWVGGDHMPMGRFFAPLVVPLLLLQMEAAVEILRRTRSLPGRAPWFAAGVLWSCILLAGFLPTVNRRRLPASFAISNAALTRQWMLAGGWLREHVPPGTWMATNAAGAVAYYSGLPVIDMLGLNDTHIAHTTPVTGGGGTAGHEKRDFDYVLARRPGVIFRGVLTAAVRDGELQNYPDGSVFRRREVPMGSGPVADDFGTVRVAPLFIVYEERVE